MSANHMPGPWHIDGQFDADVTVEIVSPDNRQVCEVGPCLEEWTDEEIANARLIATAPELLKELKSIVKRFRSCVVASGSDEELADAAVADTLAVIAKAEGRV